MAPSTRRWSTRAGAWLRAHRLVVLPCVVFVVLVALRLSDPWNTMAAGPQLLVLELLALTYHLRAATRRGATRPERRPWLLTSAALTVLIAGGIGFSPGEAILVAERILTACQDPVTFSGHTVRLRASIGVALADRHDPAGRCEPDELLHRADQAMYAAKRGTKNSWALYGPDTVGAGPGRPATRASA